MPQFQDDELDDIPATVKPTASTTPTTTTTSTPNTASAAAAAPATEVGDVEDEKPAPAAATKTSAKSTEDDIEDLDVDFGDSKLMAKGDGLNRIRADKNKVVRFALLPFIKPKVGKSHFVEAGDKKGTFRCAPVKNEGEVPYCDAKLEKEGQFHVVALAVQYTNADSKNGGYAKDANGQFPAIEWEVGYVDLSRSNYRSVSALPPEDSDVYDIDMVMSKKDNGIGYEFMLKANKARWCQNPELAKEVEAAAQKFIRDGGKKLIGKLGRKLSVVEWKALLAGQASSGKEASLQDIEDM